MTTTKMKTFLITSILTVAAILHLPAAAMGSAPWSYDDHHGDGPSAWKNTYEKCGGTKQSPIDVVMRSTQHDASLTDFQFTGYDSAPASYAYELSNNGHTAQLSIKAGEMTISGGALPRSFQLAQFHFHWGGNDKAGSEHTINGKSYPMEFHLVHYNKDYPNISSAVPNQNGLAVLGIFAEIGETTHAGIQKVLDGFANIRNAGEKASVAAFPLGDLLPAKRQYVRYSGSLTTPGCFESVIWTVFRDPIKISQTQMNQFRTLNHNAAGQPDVQLVNNYRPVQPLNGRRVSRSYSVLDSADISGTVSNVQSGQLAVVVAAACVTLFAVSGISRN